MMLMMLMMLMLVHPGACLLLHNWSTDWHAGPRRSTFLSLSDQIAILDSTVLCLVEDLHSITVLECWSAPGDRLPACLPVTPSSGSKLNQSPASFHFVTGIIITTVISSAYMNMNIKDFDPNTQCRGISMSHYLYFYLPSLKRVIYACKAPGWGLRCESLGSQQSFFSSKCPQIDARD